MVSMSRIWPQLPPPGAPANRMRCVSVPSASSRPPLETTRLAPEAKYSVLPGSIRSVTFSGTTNVESIECGLPAAVNVVSVESVPPVGVAAPVS